MTLKYNLIFDNSFNSSVGINVPSVVEGRRSFNYKRANPINLQLKFAVLSCQLIRAFLIMHYEFLSLFVSGHEIRNRTWRTD